MVFWEKIPTIFVFCQRPFPPHNRPVFLPENDFPDYAIITHIRPNFKIFYHISTYKSPIPIGFEQQETYCNI